MREPLLDKLDRKFGRYALRNLMTIIVVITGALWIVETIVWYQTGVSIYAWLYFDKAAILQGQVWRVITFVFIPEWNNLINLIISLYFYWLIGNALEQEWGSLRFDLFYLCGILGAIASGFITGFATNSYLNLSLFLAFALINPDYRILLFFFIPVKVKWLALVDAIGLAIILTLQIINLNWAGCLALVMALVNLALFFFGRLFRSMRMARRRRKWKKEARRNENDYPFDL